MSVEDTAFVRIASSAIGLTLDDILHYEIHPEKTFAKQSPLAWVIIGSVVHEPLSRELFEDPGDSHMWCITLDSRTVRYYNTINYSVLSCSHPVLGEITSDQFSGVGAPLVASSDHRIDVGLCEA